MGAAAGPIMMGLTALSVGSSIAGSRNSAKAARKQGEFAGSMYDKAAADAIARGDEAANQTAASGRVLTGSQRASFAAQGIGIDSGSAHDVIASDRSLNALDIMTIHNNAEREAYGLRQQAKFARMGGQNAAGAYNNQAWSTLLGGAGSLLDNYRRFGLRSDADPRTVTGRVNGGVNRYAM